ncbi:N-acyl amino acid synthase FeeM domain-containing protein [Nocardia sp. NPDC003979]
MNWHFNEFESVRPHDTGVYLAESDADIDNVDRVWLAVYGKELGWLSSENIPTARDRYFKHGSFLLAVVRGHIVGTMRLVRDSEDKLPVEQFASIDAFREPSRRLVECQRLMVLGHYRNQVQPEMPYGVFGALVKGCLHWCIRNNYSHIIADLFRETPTTPIDPLLALGFSETGIEFVDTELDEPCVSTALILDVGELFSRSFRSDSPFYQYLMKPDRSIAVYS